MQTPTTLIGIESKRFEPFRDAKRVRLSAAYDRPVWGGNMKGYERMRDRLRSREERFVHLDAAQLVKHAFGLVTESRRQARTPVLFSLLPNPRRGMVTLFHRKISLGTVPSWLALPRLSLAMRLHSISQAIGNGSKAGASWTVG